MPPHRLTHRRSWTTMIGRIVLSLIVAYILLNLGRAIQANYHINRSIDQLQASIADLEDRLKVLTYEIAYYSSNAYQSLEVKRRLGYKAVGETVVLVPTNADPDPSAQSMVASQPASPTPSDENAISPLETARQNAATWFAWLRQ